MTPQTLRAGDSFSFTPDVPSEYEELTAEAGWTLVFTLVGQQKFTFTSTTTPWTISAPAALTEDLLPGRYSYAVTLQNDVDRYTVAIGSLEVLANLTALESYDGRTHARRVLDAIEAVIERRASIDQESMSILGRSLVRTPISELIRLRDEYRREVLREDVTTGIRPRQQIKYRFVKD